MRVNEERSAFDGFEYNARTVIGLTLLLAGIISGLYFGWWLSFEGDIIEIIHNLKMGLPGWAWTILRFGLSVFFGIVYIAFFVVLAVMVFAWGRKK